MTIILKQKYIICTIEATDPLSFKTTHYTLAGREFNSDLKIEYLIKEIDKIVDDNTITFKHNMRLNNRQFWVRYSYSYEDQTNKNNWGKNCFCLFNPLYATADINARDSSLIRIDFAKKERA